MQIYQFTIKNFKGIKELTLDFDNNPFSPIITLVGLNESGKTTILEALSFFYERTVTEEGEIKLHNVGLDKIEDLIPKNKKYNFSDNISLEAKFTFDEADKKLIKDIAWENDFHVKYISDQLNISYIFPFVNSNYNEEGVEKFWNFEASGTATARKTPRDLYWDRSAWQAVVNELKKRIPKIIYYPNFLFDFPDRIYLTESEGEKREQGFYRRLIKDILDFSDSGLNIEDHLYKRAISGKESDREAIDGVIDRISSLITRVVLLPTLKILGDEISKQEIRVSPPNKEVDKESWYLEIMLKDDDERFYIRERSLGFRWIFIFFIFTQFRVLHNHNDYKILFLFDEPASNLHQTAQQRLMNAFSNLVNDENVRIIYTTHSHHLINPKWLEATYIVKNEALTYDNDSFYTSKMTDIKVQKYRRFVAEYPDQKTYFQPILDVLEYQPSNLEAVPNVIMVEGKNDFYTIAYMNDVVLENPFNLNLLPGGGAGSLDSAIQLYYAWGRDFHVLLDSDKEGDRQKGRYLKEFGRIIEGRVHTLEDIVPEFTDFDLEDVFDSNDYLKIQAIIDPSLEKFKKSTFNLAIQECLICKLKPEFTPETIKNFEKLIGGLFELLNTNK